MSDQKISTYFDRIERARKVVLWRDKEQCTWKWIGKMLKLPPGACSLIYQYGKRLSETIGPLPNSAEELRDRLTKKYGENGWFRVGNYGMKICVLKELSRASGLKHFQVGGKFYVK